MSALTTYVQCTCVSVKHEHFILQFKSTSSLTPPLQHKSKDASMDVSPPSSDDEDNMNVSGVYVLCIYVSALKDSIITVCKNEREYSSIERQQYEFTNSGRFNPEVFISNVQN